MKKLPLLALCPIVAALVMGATSAYANGPNCSFQASGATIAFGNLNPSTASNVMTAVTVGTSATWGACQNVTMNMTADNGQYFSGSRRLANAGATDFIPYTLSALPSNVAGPGNNTYVAFTFNATILGSSYTNASAGLYTDNVFIFVNP
jgi:hypothetical protein